MSSHWLDVKNLIVFLFPYFVCENQWEPSHFKISSLLHIHLQVSIKIVNKISLYQHNGVYPLSVKGPIFWFKFLVFGELPSRAQGYGRCSKGHSDSQMDGSVLGQGCCIARVKRQEPWGSLSRCLGKNIILCASDPNLTLETSESQAFRKGCLVHEKHLHRFLNSRVL